MLGIAAYDGTLSAGTCMALQSFILNHKSADESIRAEVHQYICVGDSHVDRARNRIVKAFLNTDCSHLFFIDSDIGFTPQQIDALLARDVEIVGGLYPKKEIGEPKWVMEMLPEVPQPDHTGLIECKFVGTGYVLIARKVFEKFIESKPEIEYEDDSDGKLGTMWAFFGGKIKDRRWLSEDWNFCADWREMGGKIYADTNIILGHTGKVTFPVVPQLLEPVVKP